MEIEREIVYCFPDITRVVSVERNPSLLRAEFLRGL